MNLAEFNALVVGDQIKNAMTNSEGTVSRVEQPRDGGVVSVQWAGSRAPTGASLEFHYSMHSTAWYHWNKVDNSATAPDTAGFPK